MLSGITGYLYVFILHCNETPLERDPILHKKTQTGKFSWFVCEESLIT